MTFPTCQNALLDQVVLALDRVVPSKLNNALAVAAAAAAGISALVAARILRQPPNLRRYDPDELPPNWRGMKGALLIVAVICLIEPLRVALMAWCNSVVYMIETWDVLTVASTNIAGTAGGPLLVFQALIAPIQFVSAVALVIALIQRRRVFRNMGIGYLIGSVAALAITEVLINRTLPESREVLYETSRRLSTMAAVALPATGYLLLSRRVQATFCK